MAPRQFSLLCLTWKWSKGLSSRPEINLGWPRQVKTYWLAPSVHQPHQGWAGWCTGKGGVTPGFASPAPLHSRVFKRLSLWKGTNGSKHHSLGWRDIWPKYPSRMKLTEMEKTSHGQFCAAYRQLPPNEPKHGLEVEQGQWIACESLVPLGSTDTLRGPSHPIPDSGCEARRQRAAAGRWVPGRASSSETAPAFLQQGPGLLPMGWEGECQPTFLFHFLLIELPKGTDLWPQACDTQGGLWPWNPARARPPWGNQDDAVNKARVPSVNQICPQLTLSYDFSVLTH